MAIKRGMYRKRKGIKRYRRKRQIERTLTVRGRQQTLLPDKFRNKLIFTDLTNSLMTNNGVTYCSRRYQVNYLYDIDPTGGSAAIAGYAELADLYYYYRVNAIKYEISFVNNETTPICVGVVPSQADLGVNYSSIYSYIQSQNYAKSMLLSGKGGSKDTGKITGYLSLRRFAGGKDFDYDSTFRGQTTPTAPTDLIWLNFGAAIQGSASFSTAGISYTTKITLYVDWYNLKTLVT